MREYYHVEGKRHSGEIEYAVLMESAVQADILMQWAQKNLSDWEWTIEIARTEDDAESCIKFLAEAYEEDLTYECPYCGMDCKYRYTEYQCDEYKTDPDGLVKQEENTA